MRIIITKNGKYVLKEIENDQSINTNYNPNHNAALLFKKFRNFSGMKLPRLSKNYSSLKSFYETSKNKRWNRMIHTKSSLSQKKIENFFTRDESKINKNELNLAKKIKLVKSKINISQQFLDKYDDLDSTYKDKINKLNNTLKTKEDKGKEEKLKKEILVNNNLFNNINKNPNNIENNNPIIKPKKNILLGDIISIKNLIGLRTMISKDNTGPQDLRIPLDDKNKDSFNFRTKYEDKKLTYDNLAILLNLPMNPDRTNLIEYLKQSKNISPVYFENLLKYNDNQIYKLNKICQIIFHKKEDEIKEAKLIEDRKFNKEKIIRQKSNNYMRYVNSIINQSNKIISDYTLRQESNNLKRKKMYMEETKKIKKKYWDKYGVNKLYKEGQKVSQDYLSTTDFEEMQAKDIKKKNFEYSKSTPDLLSKY